MSNFVINPHNFAFHGLIYEGPITGTMNAFFSSNTPIRGLQAYDVSGLTGNKIKSASVKLRRDSPLGGIVYCRIYTDATTQVIAEQASETYNNATISITAAYYEFTFTGNTTISDDYRIAIYYDSTGTLRMSRNSGQGSPTGAICAVNFDGADSPPGAWKDPLDLDYSYDIKLYS